jgi:hypothetical protein
MPHTRAVTPALEISSVQVAAKFDGQSFEVKHWSAGS